MSPTSAAVDSSGAREAVSSVAVAVVSVIASVEAAMEVAARSALRCGEGQEHGRGLVAGIRPAAAESGRR